MDNFDNQKFKNKYRIKSTRLAEYDYSQNGAYFITICVKNREHLFGEIIDGKLLDNERSKICIACWLDLPNHYGNCILDAFVIMPNHAHLIIFIQNDAVAVETGFVETGFVETGFVETGFVETGFVETGFVETGFVETGFVETGFVETGFVETGFVETGFVETGFVETGFVETGFVETGFVETGFVETGFVETGFVETGFVETGFVETGLKPVSTATNTKQYSVSEIIRGFKTFSARKINNFQNTQGMSFWQSRFYDHIIRNEDELNRIRKYIQDNPANWENDRNNL